MSIAAFLATMDLFADLPEEVRGIVEADMEVVDVPPGGLVFEVGDTGDAVYFVLEGWVHLESEGVVIANRGRGECVGEFALIDQAPRSASARAAGAARLVRWPRAAFARALAEHPTISGGLFRLLTAKLREDVDIHVAHAVQEARWQLEMELAREVQQGLFPPPEAVIGDLELACACASAGHVGGDLYDYVALGDAGPGMAQAVGVLVGDVTGHGVHSALLAAMAKGCLHNQLASDPRPGAVIRALAATLELLAGKTLLMSAAYLLVAGQTFAYANAGHPPILHVAGAERKVVRLDALDPVLGVVGSALLGARAAERTLAPGDLLVVYTDGVTEARNHAGERFGAERLEVLLERERYASAAACRQGIVETVSAFCGGREPDDDFTLVVVRA